MLVLSRHKNETIHFGHDLIQVVVVDIRGDKVRLGIEAPISIPVHRSEVVQAIHRNGTRQPLSASLVAAGRITAADVLCTGDATERPPAMLLQFRDFESLREALASGFVQFEKSTEAPVHHMETAV